MAGLLTLFAPGCASVPPVVKIGFVGPFEGRYREIGYDAIYSARLAIRDENSKDDLGDYRVALVALDDFGDPETASEIARSLVGDPGVVAVVGHWLPETTDQSEFIYQSSGVQLIAAGRPPFGEMDPQLLPEEFVFRYDDITPFEETAGPYAGAGYDAVGLVLKAIAEIDSQGKAINRENVSELLAILDYQGITGEVYLPKP